MKISSSRDNSFEQCRSFIDAHLKPTKAAIKADQQRRFRSITISRETGSGAHAVAEDLAAYLRKCDKGAKRPWTVFDRNLVSKVLEDHHLPKRLAAFMPEDRITELQDAMDELFGLRPASWTLVQQTSETMLRLMDLGNVILIGRGGSVVGRHRDDVLHVRFVGSPDKRAAYLRERENISRKAALARIEREDKGRIRYVKKYFDTRIDDPLLYHLTVNTDDLPLPNVTKMIADLVLLPAKAKRA